MLKKIGPRGAGFWVREHGERGLPRLRDPAARAVADGTHDLGILLDGSGIGMSVAANKVRGVRAGLVHDTITAHRAREHNHCNVLCMGTDLLSEEQIRQIVEIFLTTPFGEGRHVRRIDKLSEFERQA